MTVLHGHETLWSLALGGQPIDAAELAAALDDSLSENHPDFRTRLLVRDSLGALGRHWGADRLESWLAERPARAGLERAWRSDLGPPGFPTLRNRIMDATRPDTVLQFFRELGSRLHAPRG